VFRFIWFPSPYPLPKGERKEAEKPRLILKLSEYGDLLSPLAGRGQGEGIATLKF